MRGTSPVQTLHPSQLLLYHATSTRMIQVLMLTVPQ